MVDQALHGVIALELTTRVAARVCGDLLAQLGATVFVIQPDGSCTNYERRGPLSIGKRQLSIDLSAASDRALLHDLATASDALIVSSDTSSPLLTAVPIAVHSIDRVVCDITAFGRFGPLAGVSAGDAEVQAYTGIIDTTGFADAPPMPCAVPVVEYMTGTNAAAAVLAALRARRRLGHGQCVDMALYDSSFQTLSSFFPRILESDTATAQRTGNRHTLCAPWNAYRARDGWVVICTGSNSQWQRLTELIGQPELGLDRCYLEMSQRVANVGDVDAIVEAWTRTQTVTACVERLSAAEIPCGPITAIDGAPREVNLEHRGMILDLGLHASVGERRLVPQSPLRMSLTPGRVDLNVAPSEDDRLVAVELASRPQRPRSDASAPTHKNTLPLHGVRIIEIGHYTTVPLAGRLLASLGAEVIKVEPPEGEAMRMWPPARNGQGVFFTYSNSDKQGLVLDLRRDSDAGILGRLLERSDVLIENLKPGSLAKRGFSLDDLRRINGRLVTCAVSGFGADSLYVGRPAFDTVVQAMSGIMHLNSGECTVPVKCGISFADILGGEMAVLAVLAALEYRDRTGRGQYIDLSMQDVCAWATGLAWNGGPEHVPPTTLVGCRDGFVLAMATKAQVRERARDLVVDQAGVILEPNLDRKALIGQLVDAGIQSSPVLSVREALNHPHTRARNLWLEAEAHGTRWTLLASCLRLEATPPVVRQPAPSLGEHTQKILNELRLGEGTA